MVKIRCVAPTPDAELLRLLDELRRQVEAGEVVGVAFAAVTSDNTGSFGWHTGNFGLALIGATSQLLHLLNIACDEAA